MSIRLAVFLAAIAPVATAVAQSGREIQTGREIQSGLEIQSGREIQSGPESRTGAAAQSAAASAVADERVFAAEDREVRAAVEAELRAGLDADRKQKGEPANRLALLRTLAVAAARELPAGSRAQSRVEQALARATAAPAERAAAALDELRLDLVDVQSDLAFRPTREAELPKGFPDFGALDEIELRDYPAYRMVRAPMKRNGSTGAFWMLFQHIKKNDIAMTTPVQFDYAENGERPTEQSMAFLYGDAAIGEAGKQGKVEVVDVPEATVLSLGARGYERPDRVEELRERLRAYAAAHATEFEVVGAMRMMGYNSPSVGDDERYFEVQLPVKRRPTDSKGEAPKTKGDSL